ncbi:MAG: MBL fold metallo-hydrolase [Anaerolineales bacterium]|jgi:glyoxylase-like metal-dependent hydrolase (beta-lactamase superfamily II)
MGLKKQHNQNSNIKTLDLHFQGLPRTIASYLIPHQQGAILIESGPSSTLPYLKAGLSMHDLTPDDITDVLLTHIHLDHAGAAGWLAHHGARIHVHHIGAPHMTNPEKLLSSAERIYGDQMKPLWGEFLPVPSEKIRILQDNDLIYINGLQIRALDTPGHAYHHMAYIFQDVCFCGDIGGVRIDQGLPHIRVPMPPPEFDLDKWRVSLERLRNEDFKCIAPTHFGVYTNSEWHLEFLNTALDEVQDWMEVTMPQDPSLHELRNIFTDWSKERSLEAGLKDEWLLAFETVNPSWMSADGIRRYWYKQYQKTDLR